MNPMMMMMLPHLLGQDSSKQNPMNMMVMATLMKGASSQGSDYDYDYGYNYDDSSAYDYDYDNSQQGGSSSSPLSSIIQQMIQQKLAAHTPAVQVSSNPKAEPTQAVEIAPQTPDLEMATPQPQDKAAHPSDQVSYRNAP
jgi:hypothetical protein